MATENTVSSPRIDRKFVDERGNLTQNAYALLYGLIVRTGGVTAPVIDMDGMDERFTSLEAAPISPDLSGDIAALSSFVSSLPAHQPQAESDNQLNDGQIMAVLAELDQLRARVKALEIGYHV
jgi:hypothetical protein